MDKAIAAARAFGGNYELILVSDGSPDRSSELVAARAAGDSSIILIELARNFGHHAAALCAVEHARGTHVFLVDSDLEVDPKMLGAFKTEMDSTGADVVYGVQIVRRGKAVPRVLGGLFWRIFNVLSDTKVPANIMTERLMTRGYVDAMKSMGDKNLFMAGMFFWPGFIQVPLAIDKVPRKNESSYSLRKRVVLMITAISSFSSVPLISVFWCGFAIFILTMGYSVYLLTEKLLYPETVMGGFTALALFSSASFGVNFMALGTLGLYLHRIFRQVQDRPRYIVRAIIGGD